MGQVLEFIDDYDWAEFIDAVVGTVEESLQAKLDAFRQSMKEKLRPNAVTYGIISDAKDFVEKTLEKLVKIETKIQELTDRITALIESTKQWYDDLKAETYPQRPAEYYLEQLYNKIIDEILKIVNDIVDSILKVYEMVLDKISDAISGVLGGNTIGEAIYELMDKLLANTIEMIMDGLRMALQVLNFIDDYDWAEFIDAVVGKVEESLEAKLDAFR